MLYFVDGSKFSFSYSALREDYERYCAMTDEEFVRDDALLNLLHFCCVCAYFKELGIEATVSDKGIIHELIHLLLGMPVQSLREIRSQFEIVCKLA